MTSQSRLITGRDGSGWISSVPKRRLNAAGLAPLASQDAEAAP